MFWMYIVSEGTQSFGIIDKLGMNRRPSSQKVNNFQDAGSKDLKRDTYAPP